MTSNPGLPLNVTKTVAYDAIGNIVNKSDVGNYTYDPARIHAVAGIVPGTTGTLTASYTYDGNGNLLTGNGRTVTWTSFDMVAQVVQGSNSLTFTYDSERNRLKQVSSDGSTKYYLNDPISGIMAEKIVGASLSVTWNDYVMVGAEMVALKVSGAATQIRYFHKDHLGSITALTDETGATAELNSFDAWGQRRMPAGPDDPLFPGLSLTSQFTRGYTGHEQLDQVGLIHMNGRIYDPVIGKMMSADPTVPNPIDGQSYNRYSYVGNNPLSLTDPTGFRPDDLPSDKNSGGPNGRRGDSHPSPGPAKGAGGDQTEGGIDLKGRSIAQSGGVWDDGLNEPAPPPLTWEDSAAIIEVWAGRARAAAAAAAAAAKMAEQDQTDNSPDSAAQADGDGGASGADPEPDDDDQKASPYSKEDLDRIEKHLDRLDPENHDPRNRAALDRLRAGKTTLEDKTFFEHEMTEIDLMDANPEMTPEAAHRRTLDIQGIKYQKGYERAYFGREIQDAHPNYF